MNTPKMKQMVLRPSRTSVPAKTVHIAVDFGTTFTAAAYAIDHGNEQAFNTTIIQIISKWPSGTAWNERDVNDIPTELLYRHGQKEAVAWGWEARNSLKTSKEAHKLRKNYATRFKLLLSQKENTKVIRQDLQRRILLDGRSPIDLIVDFLTPLRKHILNFIQKKEDEEEEFRKWALQWTLTVPADWGPHARRQMKEAAQRAGFEGVIKLISEPEAAALYILEKRAEERKKLTLENAAVVGDLGGGTIDCATYQISGLEPLSLGALAHVQGRIFGSSNLNDGFRRHLEPRLDDAFGDYLEHDSKMSRDQILDRATDWFEVEKRGFRGPDESSLYAPVPWLQENEEKRFAPGSVELSSDDLLSIFDPIIEQIIDLLNEQIFNSVHYRMKVGISRSKFKVEKIFLTGGLAANPYVEHRVKVAFENERVHSYPIPVVTPPSPETAVVLGAVWRSLCPETITRRVSETSYGFRRDESYSEGWPYGGPGPVKNSLTGAIEVKDRMKWVVKQGEAFKNNERVHYRLERFVPVGGSLLFEESLYYSDTVKDDHVHYEEPDIHFLENLPFNLEKWRKSFEVMPNQHGDHYMMIEYDLVSIFSQDEWLYEIEVMQSKTRFKGSTNISAALKLSQGTIQD